jgi:hypothetical protein
MVETHDARFCLALQVDNHGIAEKKAACYQKQVGFVSERFHRCSEKRMQFTIRIVAEINGWLLAIPVEVLDGASAH